MGEKSGYDLLKSKGIDFPEKPNKNEIRLKQSKKILSQWTQTGYKETSVLENTF